MPDNKEIVTFHADGAEDAQARFVHWAGDANAALDLGVGSDGYRRYRVDAALWLAYVREKTAPQRRA